MTVSQLRPSRAARLLAAGLLAASLLPAGLLKADVLKADVLSTARTNAEEQRWGTTLAIGEGAMGQRHDTYRVSIQRHWNHEFWSTNQFSFTGFWDAGLTLWDASSIQPGALDQGARRLWVFGASPVLRWQFRPLGQFGLQPFLELGIGLSLLSDRELRSGNNRALRLGTRWQFEDRAALGLRFGQNRRWTLAIRRMHHSNLNAAADNAGIDSLLFSLGRRF